jgi:hypothetical protein
MSVLMFSCPTGGAPEAILRGIDRVVGVVCREGVEN